MVRLTLLDLCLRPSMEGWREAPSVAVSLLVVAGGQGPQATAGGGSGAPAVGAPMAQNESAAVMTAGDDSGPISNSSRHDAAPPKLSTAAVGGRAYGDDPAAASSHPMPHESTAEAPDAAATGVSAASGEPAFSEEARAQENPDFDVVGMLVSMGFERKLAARSLKQARGDLETALDICAESIAAAEARKASVRPKSSRRPSKRARPAPAAAMPAAAKPAGLLLSDDPETESVAAPRASLPPCEDCTVEPAAFGMPEEGDAWAAEARRWCPTCAKAHRGAVPMRANLLEPRATYQAPQNIDSPLSHSVSGQDTRVEAVVIAAPPPELPQTTRPRPMSQKTEQSFQSMFADNQTDGPQTVAGARSPAGQIAYVAESSTVVSVDVFRQTEGAESSPATPATRAPADAARSATAPVRAPAPAAADSSTRSEYEMQRDENIKRNQEFLGNLGVSKLGAAMPPGTPTRQAEAEGKEKHKLFSNLVEMGFQKQIVTKVLKRLNSDIKLDVAVHECIAEDQAATDTLDSLRRSSPGGGVPSPLAASAAPTSVSLAPAAASSAAPLVATSVLPPRSKRKTPEATMPISESAASGQQASEAASAGVADGEVGDPMSVDETELASTLVGMGFDGSIARRNAKRVRPPPCSRPPRPPRATAPLALLRR